MSRFRLAVIGCGSVTTGYHLPALRFCPDVELAAVVDVDPAWASTVAKRFNATRALSDYRDLVGVADGVIVATPNTTHVEIADFCLKHGLHVLCEKPVATKAADVRQLMASAASHGTRWLAGHSLRHAGNLQAIKSLLDRGTLTPPITITGMLGKGYKADAYRTDFRRNVNLSGGGVLLDLGVHLIDVAIWLAGTPDLVMSTCVDTLGWGVEHDAEVVLSFPHGSTAVLGFSFTRPGSSSLRVDASDGWAVASFENGYSDLQFFSAKAPVCRGDGAQSVTVPDPGLYPSQIRHFCSSIQSARPFCIESDEVLAGLRVIDQCYQLWRTETCQTAEPRSSQARMAL